MNLTEDQLNAISSIAKERKSNQDKRILYGMTPEDVAKGFIESYLFLENLMDNLSTTQKEVSDILAHLLKGYVKEFDDVYPLYLDLQDQTIDFGKSETIRSIKEIIIHRGQKLRELVDIAFPIGRTVHTFDPNTSAGLQK